MMKYCRPFFIGMIALSLLGTGAISIAEARDKKTSAQRPHITPHQRFSQRKAQPPRKKFNKKKFDKKQFDRKRYRQPTRKMSFQDKKTSSSKRTVQSKPPQVENSLIRPSKRQVQPNSRNFQQDRARQALKSGRIVSLSVIRQRVRQSFPGKIVDVRLQGGNRSSQPYTYNVKVLRKDGKLLSVRVDGTTAKIMSVKGNK